MAQVSAKPVWRSVTLPLMRASKHVRDVLVQLINRHYSTTLSSLTEKVCASPRDMLLPMPLCLVAPPVFSTEGGASDTLFCSSMNIECQVLIHDRDAGPRKDSRCHPVIWFRSSKLQLCAEFVVYCVVDARFRTSAKPGKFLT